MAELRALTRVLSRNRASSAAAVAVMACAIATAALTFAVADAALWRALPYRDADRLTLLTTVHRHGETNVSVPDFRAVRSGATEARVAAAGAFTPDMALTGFGEPRQIRGRVLSAGYFGVLGVPLADGRDFDQNEEGPGRGNVAILTDHLWQQLFDRRPAVGSTVTLNGRPHTIVGVLPPFRDYLGAVDVYVPYQFSPVLPRKLRLLAPVARLERMERLPEFNDQIRSLTSVPDDRDADGYTVAAVPMRDTLASSSRSRVGALFAGGIALLGIAVLNFTLLMTARGLQRSPEFTTRRMLGASSFAVIRLAGAEAAVLCATGALLAWGAAQALLPFVQVHYGGGFVNQVQLGSRVATFSGVVALAAIGAALLGVRGSFRTAGPSRSVAKSAITAGRSAIVLQLAMSLALVVTSALLARSFSAQRSVDPGFAIENQHTTRIALPGVKYPDPAKRAAFWNNLIDRLEGSGLRAAITTELPLSGQDNPTNFMAQTATGGTVTLKVRSVSPAYFNLMRIPLREGRLLSKTDRQDAPFAVVINEALASEIAHIGPPVGQSLIFNFGNGPRPARIIGVVADIRHVDLKAPPAPEAYGTFEQTPLGTYSVVVHSAGSIVESRERLRAVLNTIDPDQPFAPVVPLGEHVDRTLAPARLQAGLMTAFSLSAITIAASGLYSVLTFLVSASRRDWAIRLAIGATPSNLRRSVLRQALGYAAAGAVAGMLILAVVARPVASLLYGVSVWDLPVMTGSAVLLAFVCVAAAAIPARRAGRVSPVEALAG